MGLGGQSTAPLSFADRKSWALRQGNPLWLWPEVAPNDWRAAMAQIERACVAILSGRRPAPLCGDPAVVGLAGYTSGTGPLLGWWVEEGRLSGCPADIEKALRHQLRANTDRMAGLLEEARSAVELLARSGIGVTLLKGAHSALAYFPSPGCRPMSDIDLLVAPADAQRAEGLLERAGYHRIARTRLESTWRLDSSDHPSTALALEADDPWSLDLHLSLDVPGAPGAARAHLSARHDESECNFKHFAGAKVLAQPLLLLHLAAHAGSGFHNLTLLRLVEIVFVARADRAAEALDWQEFLEIGRATRSLAFAYPALALARRLSPADIPARIVEQCEAKAPPAVRRLLAGMRPAAAHRIDRPSIREHYAWTSGAGGWLRRLAADLFPEPNSLRKSAAIQASRARGLLRSLSPWPIPPLA